MSIKMKPETIERRRLQRIKDTKERKAQLITNLKRNAERDGPDSIWPELLAEIKNNYTCNYCGIYEAIKPKCNKCDIEN